MYPLLEYLAITAETLSWFKRNQMHFRGLPKFNNKSLLEALWKVLDEPSQEAQVAINCDCGVIYYCCCIAVLRMLPIYQLKGLFKAIERSYNLWVRIFLRNGSHFIDHLRSEFIDQVMQSYLVKQLKFLCRII